jgi:hypothetical protein
MKTYSVYYSIQNTLKIEAETAEEAQRKFEQLTFLDLACYAADNLVATDPVEEGKEGLSQLKPSDMLHRATW